MAIITSILDEDLYKLTQQQAVFHQYPDAIAKYEFRCRDPEVAVTLGDLVEDIREEVHAMSCLRLTKDELHYLDTLDLFKDDCLDFLQYNFWMNPVYVNVYKQMDGQLHLTIHGPWQATILFEVKLLAIISELYFKRYGTDPYEKGEKILLDKIPLLKSLRLLEFGTRRRFSKDWQHNYVYPILARHMPIKTSNVKIAMNNGTKPVGTMAHEWISAHLALAPIMEAQKRALFVWLQEYDGELGVALTDTFTTQAFFQDFDKVLTNTYSGIRQDSGDPIEFGENAIAHYMTMGVDPMTKTLVFSDGLNPEKAVEIQEHFEGRVNVAFGIGTNLTNDVGLKALNMVIKLTALNGVEVCKISDSPTKAIGPQDLVDELLNGYNIT